MRCAGFTPRSRGWQTVGRNFEALILRSCLPLCGSQMLRKLEAGSGT